MSVTTVLHVVGMTCGHCESAVRGELSTIAGVSDVAVDLATGEVVVTSDDALSSSAVAAAVDEAGYSLAP